MATAPKIPKEQSSFADHGAALIDEAAVSDRRDSETRAQSAHPGDADVNLNEQVRYGNLKQNLTTHWQVQER